MFLIKIGESYQGCSCFRVYSSVCLSWYGWTCTVRLFQGCKWINKKKKKKVETGKFSAKIFSSRSLNGFSVFNGFRSKAAAVESHSNCIIIIPCWDVIDIDAVNSLCTLFRQYPAYKIVRLWLNSAVESNTLAWRVGNEWRRKKKKFVISVRKWCWLGIYSTLYFIVGEKK